MSHIIATTVTVRITFKNKDDELADVTSLKYRDYFKVNTPVGDEITIDPVISKVSTGVYEFDYVIPEDINPEIYQNIVLRIIGVLSDGTTKVAAKTLPIDWKD